MKYVNVKDMGYAILNLKYRKEVVMWKIKLPNILFVATFIVVLGVGSFFNIAYAIDDTNNDQAIHLYHASAEAISLIRARKNIDSDQITTVGFFAGIGFGITGEHEWKDKIGERKSMVLNLGVKNNDDSYGYEYTFGLDYLFHNGDYEKSNLWTYKGLSLILAGKRLYFGIPLGLRWGIKGTNGYIELMPIISDTKSYLTLGIGLRMKEIPAMPAYSPIF
jgi:hypothetical protein